MRLGYLNLLAYQVFLFIIKYASDAVYIGYEFVLKICRNDSMYLPFSVEFKIFLKMKMNAIIQFNSIRIFIKYF